MTRHSSPRLSPAAERCPPNALAPAMLAALALLWCGCGKADPPARKAPATKPAPAAPDAASSSHSAAARGMRIPANRRHGSHGHRLIRILDIRPVNNLSVAKLSATLLQVCAGASSRRHMPAIIVRQCCIFQVLEHVP